MDYCRALDAPWLRRMDRIRDAVAGTLFVAGLWMLFVQEWRAWGLLWMAAFGVHFADLAVRLGVGAWALAHHHLIERRNA